MTKRLIGLDGEMSDAELTDVGVHIRRDLRGTAKDWSATPMTQTATATVSLSRFLTAIGDLIAKLPAQELRTVSWLCRIG